MENYLIDYNNGLQEKLSVKNLKEAKAVALERAAFIKESISIRNDNNELVTTALWYNVSPEEEDGSVLVVIGNGHYQMWDDEVESIC